MGLFPNWEVFLGPPAYGRRKGSVGIVWHTTEPADPQRMTVADAKSTASWQAGAGRSSGGSYNFILGTDGCILTVPFLEASGGIGPTLNRHLRSTYPFIPALYGEAAFADPNGYVLNVALQGRTDYFKANGYPDTMIQQAADLVRWFEIEVMNGGDAKLSGHYHWQTTRSDPGPAFIDLVLERYAGLPPDEDDMQIVAIQPAKVTLKAGSQIYSAPRPDAKEFVIPAGSNPVVHAIATVLGVPIDGNAYYGVYRLDASEKPLFYHASANAGGALIPWPPQPVPVPVPPDCTEQIKEATLLGAKAGFAAAKAKASTAVDGITP